MPPIARLLLITAAVASLAGWLSYRQTYAAFTEATPEENTPAPRERKPRPLASREGKVAELRKLMGRPFNPVNSSHAWTLVRTFSVRQIKDALASLPEKSRTDAMRDHEGMLYFCWAQIDPHQAMTAALEAAKKDETKQGLPTFALTAWMKDDPDAAYRWASQSPDINKNLLSRQMAKLLSTLPPAEALAKAGECDPEVRKFLLSRWGSNMIATPADREAFLATLRDSASTPEQRNAALSSFTRSWGTTEPAEALAALDHLPMDQHARDESRRIISRYWTDSDPAAVIHWMTTGENPQPVRNQAEIYRNWAERDPDAASREFDTLSRQSPGFRDEVMRSLLTNYHQGGWIPFGRNSATEERLFSRLHTHYQQWRTSEPEQAQAWAASQEPTLRQKLESTHTHAEK